jgi:hypothetical protein
MMARAWRAIIQKYLKRGCKLTRRPWLAENVWQQLSWRTRVVFNLAQKRQ